MLGQCTHVESIYSVFVGEIHYKFIVLIFLIVNALHYIGANRIIFMIIFYDAIDLEVFHYKYSVRKADHFWHITRYQYNWSTSFG